MTTTRRFGLTREALTLKDTDLVDTVLSAFELHKHQGGPRLVDPALPPTLVLETTGGGLAAGATYFYRESWVDQFGLETAAGQEVSVTTPAPVAVPDSPQVTALTGGSLASGPTYYALSAVVGTSETSLSAPTLLSITDFHTASVRAAALTLPTGVGQFNVWRQGPRDAGFTKIGAITDPSMPYLDDGSIPSDPCSCDPSNLPPAANLTNATSKVTFTVSNPTFVGDSTVLAVVKAWRIYRTTQSGIYNNNSLLAEVNTTVNVDGTGGLLTAFVDDGSTLPSSGVPLDYSRTLTPTERIQNVIVATFADLPSAALYPDGVPAVVTSTRTFYVTQAGTWVQIDSPPLVFPSFVNLPAVATFLVGQEAIVRDTNELYVILPAVLPEVGIKWQRVGGGPPALSSPVLLTPVSRIPYAMDMSPTGHLVAVGYSSLGTSYPLNAGPVLETPDGLRFYRLGIEENGGYVTYEDPVRTSDTVYPPTLGPRFQVTTDVSYILGVDNDGCLTTTLVPTVFAHNDAPILTAPNGTQHRLVYDQGNAFPTTELVGP